MSQIVFLYNKSNPYGISEDVRLFESVLRQAAKDRSLSYTKPRHSDPLEIPILCDVAFHFEVPVYSYFPWAKRNVLIINPEWWEEGWNAYLHHTDALLFKCQADKDRFITNHYIPGSCEVFVLPWTTPVKVSEFTKHPRSSDLSVLWLLGGSLNKRAAANHILPLWKPEYPPLHVYTTTPLTLTNLAESVKVEVRDLPESTRRAFQAYHPCHLIFSQSEALGLQAHEAQAAGAFLIGNSLPTYKEAFDNSSGVFLLPSSLVPHKGGVKDTFEFITQESLENSLRIIKSCREQQEKNLTLRQNAFYNAVGDFWKNILSQKPRYSLKQIPPVLQDIDLPPITIVTLLHNRRKFVDLAFHNLLITDYPKHKIEWIVVEDSDIIEEQASDKIMKWARQCLEEKTMSVSYIPLQKPVSIGEKRNLACERAQNSIILMMDDDDHYPASSFRRRVSWLLKHPSSPQACVATTIACYDLLQGTSAVNTPPFTLGLKDRVSEATLTFYKTFWNEKPFPTVSMSEGEEFLEGREHQVLELQPQQIIVAMSHGKNVSSRRIPPGPSGKPSCFWGFPKEFLIFLHGLAGVSVES